MLRTLCGAFPALGFVSAIGSDGRDTGGRAFSKGWLRGTGVNRDPIAHRPPVGGCRGDKQRKSNRSKGTVTGGNLTPVGTFILCTQTAEDLLVGRAGLSHETLSRDSFPTFDRHKAARQGYHLTIPKRNLGSPFDRVFQNVYNLRLSQNHTGPIVFIEFLIVNARV